MQALHWDSRRICKSLLCKSWGCVLPNYVMLMAFCWQVEKSWDEVMKAFPPPLLRHRYGS